MRALVTGGAGFIGSNLVGLLIANGHEVVVLDNYTSGYRDNLDAYPNILAIEGDVRDEATLRDAMQGCEVVFHLAASVGNARSSRTPT